MTDLLVKLIDNELLNESSKIKDNLKFNITNPIFKIYSNRW